MEYKKNVTSRIGPRLKDELNKIRAKRVEIGVDQKPKSDRFLTNLIPRHKHWSAIREDMLNYGGEDDEK